MENNELIPEEGNPKVGYKVFEHVAEILKYRDTLGKPERWNRYYELRRNQHWKTKSDKVTLVTANLLGKHHMQTVNTLTDNNPTFNVTQCGDIDADTLEVMLRLCEYWWNDQEQQSVLEESVSDGETYGTVIEKAIFNPDAEFPLGEVEVEPVSLFNIGWYPMKERKLQKCEGVFHFWAMPVREGKKRFPKFAEQIQADKDLIKDLGDLREDVGLTGQAGYQTTLSGIVKSLVESGMKESSDADDFLICEAWVKDYTKDKDGNFKYKGNIRRVQCGCGGKLVFTDMDNPSIHPDLPDEKAMLTYLWDKYPFSKNYSVTDPASPYGMADYEQLEQLNIEIDKTLSQLTTMKNKAAKVKFVNPEDSGVPDEHINSFSGILKPPTSLQGNGLKWLEPPRIDPNIANIMNIYKEMFFMVAGTFDLDRADSPGKNVIAYKAIAALLENVARMLKGKIRNYSKMVRERGRMFVSLAQNWYTEERWISYKQGGADTSIPVTGEMLIIPAKLNVVSGSTMPRSQIQEREEALELHTRGAIDQEALLKKIDFPDYKAILKRMQAGPMGVLFDKLLGVGVPEQFVQYFKSIAQMEEKDIQRMLKSSELPIFDQVLQSIGLQQVQEETANPMDQLEIEDKKADIQKKMIEAQLIQEKVLTERVNQQVKIKGVEFDEEKLKIERAKLVEDMKNLQEKNVIERAKAVSDIASKAQSTGQGPYNERGIMSNNADL